MFGKPTASGQRLPRRPGERALAIANFRCALFTAQKKHYFKQRLFWRDAKANRRHACAPQIEIRRSTLGVGRSPLAGPLQITPYTGVASCADAPAFACGVCAWQFLLSVFF